MKQEVRTKPASETYNTNGNCEHRVLRRTEEDGELHELWMQPQADVLVFGEDSEGPLTKLVFGETWHRSLVEVNSKALNRAFGGETPEAFLAQSDAPLCDLMDRLDWHDIPYRYMSIGSAGMVTLHNEEQMMDFSQTLDESSTA